MLVHRAIATTALLATLTSAGCSGPGPAARTDAATVDALVYACPATSPGPARECTGGNHIDVSADPVLPQVEPIPGCPSTAAAVPGATDGSLYFCEDNRPPDDVDVQSWVVRERGDGTREVEGQARYEFCTAVLALDDHRVVSARRITWPPNHARLLVSDFALHTSRVIELPTPSGLAMVLELQAIPGGILASGWTWQDGTSTAHCDVLWQLDDAGAVVHTWLDVPRGIVVPSAAPVTLARIDGVDRVALVDLASGAVVDTRTLPLHIDRLAAGPQGVIALGRVGCDLAAMPIDSTVATVLPGVNPDRAGTTLDDRGRVVVAADLGDRHTLAVFRLDDARFDGSDGASRLDPALGPSGHAHAELGAPCVAPGGSCPPGAWSDRGLPYISSGGPDRLRACATFFNVCISGWCEQGPSYRMP